MNHVIYLLNQLKLELYIAGLVYTKYSVKQLAIFNEETLVPHIDQTTIVQRVV